MTCRGSNPGPLDTPAEAGPLALPLSYRSSRLSGYNPVPGFTGFVDHEARSGISAQPAQVARYGALLGEVTLPLVTHGIRSARACSSWVISTGALDLRVSPPPRWLSHHSPTPQIEDASGLRAFPEGPAGTGDTGSRTRPSERVGAPKRGRMTERPSAGLGISCASRNRQ